jgi:heptosyltransferase-2
MHHNSLLPVKTTNSRREGGAPTSPILIIPYMWIGDFVRCHSVASVLAKRFPERPIDILSNSNDAPLLDYMPGVRKGVVIDLPRRRLPLALFRALAERLRAESYGTALLMPRTWKSALIPFLADIPERVGFVGEFRFGLINDLRWGEKALSRMVDRCCALALPKGAPLPPQWPPPELVVPPAEVAAWRARTGLGKTGRPAVALAPGAVGGGKRWPSGHYAEIARRLTERGVAVWVIGSPIEAPLAREIVAAAGANAVDLTGFDLRNAIFALAAADGAVSNDSGLLHVAAAIGTPTIGLFGPTSPWHVGPLNPIAATIEAPWQRPCKVCGKSDCSDVLHRTTEDISVDTVFAASQRVLSLR